MIYAIEYLSKALKRAREAAKLSQRALGKRVGMPQAQISKIENARADLRASTMIELARALDLEVILVPRKQAPVVKGLIRLSDATDADRRRVRPLYRLDEEELDVGSGDG